MGWFSDFSTYRCFFLAKTVGKGRLDGKSSKFIRIPYSVASFQVKLKSVFTGSIFHVKSWVVRVAETTGPIVQAWWCASLFSDILQTIAALGISIYMYLPSHPPLRLHILLYIIYPDIATIYIRIPIYPFGYQMLHILMVILPFIWANALLSGSSPKYLQVISSIEISPLSLHIPTLSRDTQQGPTVLAPNASDKY